MNLQAEQIHLISQVLRIQNTEVLLQAREFLNKLIEEDAQSGPVLSEEELLARIDASEAAFEQGDVLSHEEVVAHFRRRTAQP